MSSIAETVTPKTIVMPHNSGFFGLSNLCTSIPNIPCLNMNFDTDGISKRVIMKPINIVITIGSIISSKSFSPNILYDSGDEFLVG